MGDGAEAPWSGCKDLKGHSTEPSCGLACAVERAASPHFSGDTLHRAGVCLRPRHIAGGRCQAPE